MLILTGTLTLTITLPLNLTLTLTVTLTLDRYPVALPIITMPSSTEHCWIRLPTGCSKTLSETKTPKVWFVDPSNRSVVPSQCAFNP